MSRRHRKQPRRSMQPPPAGASAPTATEPVQHDLRHLEVLHQAEALISTAILHAMRTTYGDELHWPCRVERPDGSLVTILEPALDLVIERLQGVLDQLGAEIVCALHIDPDVPRPKYETTSLRSREEPAPGYWSTPRKPAEDRKPNHETKGKDNQKPKEQAPGS